MRNRKENGACLTAQGPADWLEGGYARVARAAGGGRCRGPGPGFTGDRLQYDRLTLGWSRALKKVVSDASEVCGSRQSPGSSAGACERQVMNNGGAAAGNFSSRPVERGPGTLR